MKNPAASVLATALRPKPYSGFFRINCERTAIYPESNSIGLHTAPQSFFTFSVYLETFFSKIVLFGFILLTANLHQFSHIFVSYCGAWAMFSSAFAGFNFTIL
jgi:hypothetical protein